MLKKILIILLFLFVFPSSTFAAEQFAENYTVKYEIQDSGDVLVTEQVKIRNLNNTFYASNYSSSVPTGNVSEISASSGRTALDVKEKDQNGKKIITVSFPEQIIGKDKEYTWTLKYKISNFVQINGVVKQFSVPKLSPISNLEDYNLIVSIPLSLGEPTQLTPRPLAQKDVADQTEYSFNKQQIEQSGISSIFGSSQVYDLEQDFVIKNDSLLPALLPIFIPSSGLYQEIIISEITPKPENVVNDSSGNTLAYFQLGRLETKNVKLKGVAKVDLERSSVNIPLADKLPELYAPTKYWDSDSPQVQKALEVALEGNKNLTTLQKAQKIYEYVISAIEFGDYGITPEFSQNSASSILSDPKNRFCNDFVNVSIAMLRAAQIPSEQVVGSVFVNNDITKPACFMTKEQHTWVRFLDTQKGWVYMDPAWGAAGNGLTFFDSTDLSHIAVAYLHAPVDTSRFSVKSNLQYSQQEFLPQFSLKPEIIAPAELIAGFPYSLTFRISNNGNSIMPAGYFTVSSTKLSLKPQQGVISDEGYLYPAIPPFGYVDFIFSAKHNLAWQQYNESLTFTVGDQVTSHQLLIKPLFNNKFFSAIILIITFVMLGLYILSLVLHYKSKTIFEAAEETVRDIVSVIAPALPTVKIAESTTKNVVKPVNKKKSQKFRKKAKKS